MFIEIIFNTLTKHFHVSHWVLFAIQISLHQYHSFPYDSTIDWEELKYIHSNSNHSRAWILKYLDSFSLLKREIYAKHIEQVSPWYYNIGTSITKVFPCIDGNALTSCVCCCTIQSIITWTKMGSLALWIPRESKSFLVQEGNRSHVVVVLGTLH